MQVLRAGDEADLVELSRAAIARARQPKAVGGKADGAKAVGAKAVGFKVDAANVSAAGLPCVPKGTLVIVGGGRTPAVAVRQFIDAAGGPDAPLVVVTTAQAQRPAEAEAIGWLLRAGARHVRQLHTVDREHANDPRVVEMLEAARGVWFDGGRQWRLVDAYLDTQAETLFRRVLERGGVIGGTSAGATIQASYLLRGSPLGNSEIMAEGYERGFGFLPGVAIDQHFSERNRQNDMAQVKLRHPELVGLGLDEDTALIVRGQHCQVIGRGSVSVFNRPARDAASPPPRDVLRAGDAYDFRTAHVERAKGK
jgi:cyanophycinase